MRKHHARRRAVIAAIRAARLERGMSQRALSEALGEHKNYIHEVEHGQHAVRTEEFIAIAEALGVSPFDLLARVVRP